MRELNYDKEITRITDFIAKYVHSSGFTNVVIGLSGGIDSSLSAALAVKALGKDHVFGVMLPWKNSSPESYNDALILAEQLNIHHEKIDISPMVESYFQTYQPDADNLRLGNWMARTRMCVLYDLSAKYKGLVVGTSNQTELMVGYFTQHGDGACAFEPIGHLYKTEVWEMAKHLSIPAKIIEKTPTADLWANQTDEGELGITYKELDLILYDITENKMSMQELINNQHTTENIEKVQKLIQRSAFKRELPPMISE